ncbi:unnamed protein product [Kuraishia capsulata CBS 1993]|uniref:Septin-type G domain-containing protein n=1 Tax=Kuraishia capsulata CBS 1993 TaxID=1382522 RepID=W6MVV0_9ASCO|nr:uncharacterized protein KUCA_T00002537001 [Kuraishia capsulata CBS 1993]CDK26565.1 unnamed protein product [Kuraishia capsulata CBS 1993]
MAVGQSGSGRSTFINSLCDQVIVEPSSTIISPDIADQPNRDLELRKSIVELEDEEGVRISLTIIDTPGFGDSIENESSFGIISDYLRHQFDEILTEESRLKRNPRFKDGRVHACLYFIVPTGHGLRELDVEIIKALGNLVNVIPVISKSDSLTTKELALNKKLIKEDIEFYQLPVFDFKDEFLESYGDEDNLELNDYLQKTLPFAVMGSNDVVVDPETKERKRVRTYPWGSVNIEDNEISDFQTLKNTLLISHLNDMKDFTHEVLYENYRTKALGSEDDDLYSADYNPSVQAPKSIKSQSTVPHSPNVPEYMEREEQIKLEEERLKAFEERVQRDLLAKREELEARERELAEIEQKLALEAN